MTKDQDDINLLKDNACLSQRLLAFGFDLSLVLLVLFLQERSLLFVIPCLAVYKSLSHLLFGRSLGEFALGLRLISSDGTRFYQRVFIRELLFPLFILPNIYLLKFFIYYRLSKLDDISQTRVVCLHEEDRILHPTSLRDFVSALCAYLVVLYPTYMTLNEFTSHSEDDIRKFKKLKSCLREKKDYVASKEPTKVFQFKTKHNLISLNFKNYDKEYKAAKRASLISHAPRKPASLPQPLKPKVQPTDAAINQGLREYNAWRSKSRARFNVK